MSSETTKALRSAKRNAKFFVVPVGVIAAWLAVAGVVIASLNHPAFLHASIESVLSHRNPLPPETKVEVAQNGETHKR